MTIGFIGLGAMGAPMARNLVKAGFAVKGFDLTAEMPDGVVPADSLMELADQETIITMLPDGTALTQVADAILSVSGAALGTDALWIDCSTIDVATTRKIGESLLANGCGYVDAPVSGGITGAANASLTFMVGGAESDFARAKPYFDAMGQKAVHCGGIGAGQSAKICNNLILGATMIATCESFDLADRLGLDRQKLFDVVSTSSGYSWSMNAYCPASGIGPDSPADHDYTPGFAAELMLKDLRLAMEAAADCGITPAMAKRAQEIYAEFVENGGSGKDFSAILPWLKHEI